MRRVNQSLSSKSLHRPLMIVASISLAVLLFSVMFANPIIGWFKAHLQIDNPAEITNFVTAVSYTVDNSTTTPANGIPYIFAVNSKDTAVTIKAALSYQGKSAAYVRVSFCGNYYNKNTKTYLPMADNTEFVTVSNAGEWIDGKDGYWYYPTMLENADELSVFSTMELKTNTAAYATMSEKQEYEGELYVIVDAVQPNRMEAFWGRTTSPTAAP